ncbi:MULTISPECIES: hypothetical protein [unclassified Caballeronia]|uniref:hypothetical protein n=1 Tax=unclassified Caballeronia TaxID=2646786 RepID=UPI00285CD70A|nr:MULTISPECIES: hypothetical protein [unclassified Caballeronia]MDR5772468.1 hypothetical protein [Caballeronia sp. LZ002]MDR5847902.1 hypothetical protein [Caballeronia sp. LZ003]
MPATPANLQFGLQTHYQRGFDVAGAVAGERFYLQLPVEINNKTCNTCNLPATKNLYKSVLWI